MASGGALVVLPTYNELDSLTPVLRGIRAGGEFNAQLRRDSFL